MLAFETWISAQDRKSDHSLVDAASATPSIGLAFIDYAYSLSMSWPNPDAAVGAAPAYMPVPKDSRYVVQMVEAIEKLSPDLVVEIVERVPNAFLPDLQKGNIRANLASRAKNLRNLLQI